MGPDITDQTRDIAHEKGPASPIMNLPSDILWSIFAINATMSEKTYEEIHEPPALLTLSRASQVCSGWRRLILPSSSLWASVIDLDLLRKDEWREEALRRTGDAMLHIRGSCGGEFDAYLDAHIGLSILEKNWTRIRSMDITFAAVQDEHENFRNRLFQLLSRPAYVLQEFRLWFPRQIRNEGSENDDIPSISLVPSSDFILFDNTAPALVAFNAPNMEIDFLAPWVEQLKDLTLHEAMPVNELLRMLCHMPLLENISLFGDPYAIAPKRGSDPPLSKVDLPSLQCLTLSISEAFGPHLIFLNHLQLSSRCRLSLKVYVDFTVQDEVTHAKDFLGFYLGHCGSSMAGDVSLRLRNNWSYLDFKGLVPDGQEWSSYTLNVSGLPSELELCIESLPSVIPSFVLHKTKKLSLGGANPMPSFRSGAPTLSTTLPHIEVLNLDLQSIGDFLGLPRNTFISMFPKLRSLEMYHPKDEGSIGAISAFIALRILAGKPLQRLVVVSTLCPFLQVNRKLMKLIPVFNGLEIVHKIYDCDGCVT